MQINLEEKIKEELAKFKNQIKNGADPLKVFEEILPQLLKEQDEKSRHYCAHKIGEKTNIDGPQSHNYIHVINTYEAAQKCRENSVFKA